jgi:hypothetical protein
MTREALRQFTVAHEEDPFDFEVMLKLGWTLNVLHEDTRAAGWFSRVSTKRPAMFARR